MKWFFKWLRNGINNLDRDPHEPDREYTLNKATVGLAIPKVRAGSVRAKLNEGEVSLNQQPMHFRIYPATGGHIVEYTYYNEKTDRHDQALHLIPSDLDMATELSKIMTLEALKR